jgi:hypothetical protein
MFFNARCVVGAIVLGLLYWKFFVDTGPQYPPPGTTAFNVFLDTYPRIDLCQCKFFRRYLYALSTSKYLKFYLDTRRRSLSSVN